MHPLYDHLPPPTNSFQPHPNPATTSTATASLTEANPQGITTLPMANQNLLQQETCSVGGLPSEQSCNLANGRTSLDIGIPSFLSSLQLDKLQEIFDYEQISMDVLVEMGHDQLEKIGVKAFGHRQKIIKGVKDWKADISRNHLTIDISSFLSNLQLDNLQEIFDYEQITMEVLIGMGHDQLKEIGVKAFGHRHKIIEGVNDWNAYNASPASEPNMLQEFLMDEKDYQSVIVEIPSGVAMCSETRVGDKANKKPKEQYEDLKNKAKRIYSIFFKSGKNFSGQAKVWIVFYIGCKATDHVELCVEESVKRGSNNSPQASVKKGLNNSPQASVKKGLDISPQPICSDDMNLSSQKQNSQTNKSSGSNKASAKKKKTNKNHAESRMMDELKKNKNVTNKEVNVHVHFYISYSMCFECSDDLKNFSKDYNVSFDITFVTLFHFGPKSPTICCSSNAACLNEKGLRELHENPKFTFQTFNPDTWMRLQNLLMQWATVGELTLTKNNFQSVFSADVNEKWSDNGLMNARDDEDKETAEKLERIVTSDAEYFDSVDAVSQDSSEENPGSSAALTLCSLPYY